MIIFLLCIFHKYVITMYTKIGTFLKGGLKLSAIKIFTVIKLRATYFLISFVIMF